MQLEALRGISLSVSKGSFVALKGPSGSGKSTLLNIIGLIDSMTDGSYYLDGSDMASLTLGERSICREKYLGFIFQSFNLIPELNVYENVEIPLLIKKVRKKERKEMVLNIIDEVGLGKHIKHRPGELSGGQQQRVAIARALVKQPPLVIADEPTANLDSRTGRGILELMKELNERHRITFVFATHDNNVVEYMNAVYEMEDGLLADDVSRETIKT
ncbi:MAG: ABC transporter ATP-binding protein [Spirochaetales bacterium]|nr:ABC transporter ATP-binding protein [Spirochaetales bacterium]